MIVNRSNLNLDILEILDILNISCINLNLRIKNLKEVTAPIIQANSILFYKLLNSKKINSNNIDIETLKKRILNQEKNEILNLYSNNYLSKVKNTILIQLK